MPKGCMDSSSSHYIGSDIAERGRTLYSPAIIKGDYEFLDIVSNRASTCTLNLCKRPSFN